MLAPEGVAQVSVNWYALLAPVLAWLGAGLLAYRIADVGARCAAATPLARALRPLAGELAADGRRRRWGASAACWPAR